MAFCIRYLLLIMFLFTPIVSYAQSSLYGNAYNSKTGKKDICIRIRSEDGTTIDSKRCKELRITDGYLVEEDDYFIIKIEPNTTRITNSDSPYTVLLVDKLIFADTDGGAITINLLAGINTRQLYIVNTGSSGNLVTISPNGSDLFFGSNNDFDLFDLENLDFTFETTEGWM